jgi:hypothetical protein
MNKGKSILWTWQLKTRVVGEESMSLSLQDIKDELRESYLRTEEVLSGMDAYVAKLERRISVLEGQLAAITGALYAEDSAPAPKAPRIYTGR